MSNWLPLFKTNSFLLFGYLIFSDFEEKHAYRGDWNKYDVEESHGNSEDGYDRGDSRELYQPTTKRFYEDPDDGYNDNYDKEKPGNELGMYEADYPDEGNSDTNDFKDDGEQIHTERSEEKQAKEESTENPMNRDVQQAGNLTGSYIYIYLHTIGIQVRVCSFGLIP